MNPNATKASALAVAAAIASGLMICPDTRELGRRDARAGRKWSPPPGADLLAYACGYAEP